MTKNTKPPPTQRARMLELFNRLVDLLLTLLRRGRPMVGPDGAIMVDANGKAIYKDIGAADMAVCVSLLRLAGLRATLNAPQTELAAMMERARAAGWRSPESVPPAAADGAGEDDDAED